MNSENFSPAYPPYAKKKWGQNFLIDPNITRKIIDCAKIQTGESLVEIGPGRGILTKAILAQGGRVLGIEIDRDLLKGLQAEIDHNRNSQEENPLSGHLTLFAGDALKYPYKEIPAPYKVVSNLPYQISTPIVFRLLEEKNRISKMVLMVQKEIAERMVSSVGKKSYGALSIILQWYSEVKIEFFVKATCFRPRPQVESAVVSIKPLASCRIPVQNETLFLNLVKGAFQHRRKRLTNALADAGFDAEPVRKALHQQSIDSSRRGETLALTEFVTLANTMIDYL